jgi:hypothetical protein
MLGAGTAVNDTPLLLTPLACTTTLPVVAPVGTVTLIDVAAQLVIEAVLPLNVTVPVPWLDPKLVPVIVTAAPTAPEVGDKLVILGADTTVNVTPLLATPPTVTTTFPVVAPVGTFATIDVALQLLIAVTAVVLNLIVLVPCVVPKFDPVIVTEAPTAPVVGERLVMLGAAANRLTGNNMTNDAKMTIWRAIRVTMHLISKSVYVRQMASQRNRAGANEAAAGTPNAQGSGYETVIASTPPARDEVSPWPQVL